MPNVIDAQGNVVRQEPVPAALQGETSAKAHTVFRAVFRELANPRAGTASTKRRDEVRGGGKKPWRQKGTGRARQGSTRSPQWRHGGVVFGPTPRSYVTSLNKKERRAAFVAALAERLRSDAVSILDAPSLSLTKTREFAQLVFGSPKAAKNGPSTLVVFAGQEVEAGRQLERTGANLQRVRVTAHTALDVKDVLGYNRIVFTTAAYNAIVESLGAPVKESA